MKQCRDDYMPQHRAICARKYWQKIQRHTCARNSIDLEQSQSRPYFPLLSPPSGLEEGNLHSGNSELSEALDKSHTLRIVHENTFDGRLAADAITEALWWFVETENVESYKEALITALRLNITMRNVKPPHKQMNRFRQLYLFATDIDELVRGAIQINDLDYDLGTTILHAACRTGFAELLEPLFWRGACFDVIDARNKTPLDSAIRSGDIDTIRFALALGADPDQIRRQSTSLFIMNPVRRQDILTLLVEYGADINRVFEGYTLLLAATESCDFDTVRLALSLGADPNLECPLFTAFETGRHDIMRLLVEHGADVNHMKAGKTLLGMALMNENIEDVRFVLSLGADPKVGDPMWDTLECCLNRGCNACIHEDLALLLMEQDVTLLTQSRYGWTLLHCAADGAHARLLRAAMDRITSQLVLDGKDEFGSNALNYAAGTLGKVPLQQTLEMVSILLEAGADINAQNAQGATVLNIAAEKGSVELVQLLLDAGAMVGIQTYHPVHFETALSSAAQNGHITIVGRLLEKTSRTYESARSLERALRNAVRKGHGEIVKQLSWFGGKVFAGEVLGFALVNSSAEVVQILLDAGARLDYVDAFLLAELFGAGTGNPQEHCDGTFEAPLKCELLIRAFPELRERHREINVVIAELSQRQVGL